MFDTVAPEIQAIDPLRHGPRQDVQYGYDLPDYGQVVIASLLAPDLLFFEYKDTLPWGLKGLATQAQDSGTNPAGHPGHFKGISFAPTGRLLCIGNGWRATEAPAKPVLDLALTPARARHTTIK